MIAVLIHILVVVIIAGVVLWIVGMLPLDAKLVQIARVVVLLLALLWILAWCGVFAGDADYGCAPPPPYRHRAVP